MDENEITNGIAVTVGSAAILGVVAWITGFWKNLGTFALTIPASGSAEAANSSPTQTIQIKGVRIVAVVAAVALILALGALTAFFLRPPFGFGKISFTPVRFGQSGSSETGDEGARFVQMNPPGYQRLSAPIKEFPICTISEIDTGTTNNDKNCAVLEGPGGNWEVSVTGNTSCKVTCFRMTVTQ